MTDELTADARRLARFVGVWAVEGVLSTDGVDAAVSGTWEFRPVIDGWGVEATMRTEIEGSGRFGEIVVIGFDPSDATIHHVSVNRFTIRDHVGGWVGDDALEITFHGTSEGRRVRERISMDFVQDGHIEAEVLETEDDVVTITTRLSLRRTAP